MRREKRGGSGERECKLQMSRRGNDEERRIKTEGRRVSEVTLPLSDIKMMKKG